VSNNVFLVGGAVIGAWAMLRLVGSERERLLSERQASVTPPVESSANGVPAAPPNKTAGYRGGASDS
jgi:hypothetical protein